MSPNASGIIRHNMRVFYVVDTFRALWFITSIWVLFERQFLTLSQLTLIESSMIGVSLVMQLPTGAFADLLGKRTAMIIGCVTYAGSFVAYALANTFPLFLIYAVMQGIGGAFIDGTRESLLYDTLKQEHQEERFPHISSRLSMIFQIALASATIIGGFIGAYSYVTVIYMTAGAFLLAGCMSILYREPYIDTEKFTIKSYWTKTTLGVRELFKNSYIKKISLYYILIGSLTWVCAFTFNMILLTEMNYSSKEIGIAMAGIRIINSVLLFSLIGVSSLFNRTRTFILLPIILIVSFIPAIFMTKWFALIPVIGALFVSNARWNVLGKFTNAEFDSKYRATAISTLNMFIGLFYVIVVGLSGPIMEHFGGIRTIYTLLGIATLVFALPLGLHIAKHHGETR